MRQRWLAWWLLAVALLLCGVAARAAGAADTITAIEISGQRTVEPETIRAHLKFAKGGPYDPAKVDQSIKALFATGVFSDVRIERRGATVQVHVVENPIVSAVTFEGQRAIDKPKLEPLVQLKPRMRYTASRGHADAVRLRDYYRRQGRLATTVEAKSVASGEGRVDVAFVIREGEVTKVDSISFRGNRAFSPAQLRDVISTSQSGWLDIFKQAAFYDPDRIDRDKELLRRHYLKNGFPDARVHAPHAAQNEEGTGYVVTFTIDEGERYSFGAISIDSRLSGVDTAPLLSAVSVKPGATFNLETVDKSVETLTLALSDHNHAFARVKAIQKRPASARVIDIAFLVEQGPRVFVERIDIVGNKKTKDFVIRREFRIAEGDAVNSFLIERGRKRVRALGFFKNVEVTHKTGSAPDQVVLTVEVVEDDSNNLSFGVGYSMAEGVVGDISLTERNLLGNGQFLRLNLAGSMTRLQADIGFTEPRFLGSNVAAGFDLFYKDVDYTTQASYKSLKMGGSLRLGYPITEQWSTGVNYTFVRNQLYDVGPLASAAIKEAVPGFPSTNANTYYTSSVGYSLTYDTRDSKKRPSSGVYYTEIGRA